MQKKSFSLDTASQTIQGPKSRVNGDSLLIVLPQETQVLAKKGALFVVADGVSGWDNEDRSGSIASQMAVDEIAAAYYRESGKESTSALKQAIEHVNGLFYQGNVEAPRDAMGTMCIAAVVQGNTASVANVGNSRAYLIRQGQIKQISRDHSWVEEQVRAGLLTRDQARTHAQRNVIMRCLGTRMRVEVDTFTEPVQVDDILVLCTDGLWWMVEDEEIGAVVQRDEPQQSVQHLIQLARECSRRDERRGGHDMTVVVVKITL